MKEESNLPQLTSIVPIQMYTMDAVIKEKGQKKGEPRHGKRKYSHLIENKKNVDGKE